MPFIKLLGGFPEVAREVPLRDEPAAPIPVRAEKPALAQGGRRHGSSLRPADR